MKTLHCLIAGLRPAFPNVVNRIAIPSLVAAAALAPVYPCAAQSGTWTATGRLAADRSKVLVAGGFNYTSGDLASAELYDSAAPSQSRQLFFEDRVAYQRAIEEVY